MDSRVIVSGIFSYEDGLQLLEFIDNKLVQKKKKESAYNLDAFFLKYLKGLKLNNESTKMTITTDDVIKYISTEYKYLKKEDRYIVYMDSIRRYFYNLAQNKESEIFDHNCERHNKPIRNDGLCEHKSRRPRKKQIDAITVISESTDINSCFTRL